MKQSKAAWLMPVVNVQRQMEALVRPQQLPAVSGLGCVVVVLTHPGPKKPFLKIQWKKHFWNGG